MAEKKYILVPAIKRILSKFRGKKFIDIGCGSGYYSRLLAGMGYKVTGVDRSEEQLKIANLFESKKRLGINYIKDDITKMRRIKSNTFDIGLLNFVIIEITSVRNVGKVFKEAGRVIKNGGVLIIGELHPHNFNKKSVTESFFLKDKKADYWSNAASGVSKALLVRGGYLTFNDDRRYTLEFLVDSLREAGFAVIAMKEPKYLDPTPTHIVIVAKKVNP